MRWVLLLGLMACSSYRSGGVLAYDEGDRSWECLELNVARSWLSSSSRVVVQYEFGNPCRGSVPVDFTQVEVHALDGTNATFLPPFDPRQELHPARLDGGASATEVIAYEIPTHLQGEALTVCVDARRLTEGDSAERIPCFAQPARAK